jgi:hypothetical protein
MMILALLLAKVVNHPPACFSSSLMVALVASAVVAECLDEGGWRVEEEEKWLEVCGLSKEKRTLFLINIVLMVGSDIQRVWDFKIYILRKLNFFYTTGFVDSCLAASLRSGV